MTKPSVLLVMTVEFDGYGISKVVNDYCVSLKEYVNFDLLLCRSGDPLRIQALVNEGIRIIDDFPSRLKHPFKYLNRLNQLFKSKKYDVIHVNGNSATMLLEINAAYKNKIPIRIAHCHNNSCEHKIIHRFLKRKLNSQLTDALACSEQAGKWCFNNSFIVLKNAISIENYLFNEKARNEYRKLNKIESKIVLLHVGRLSVQKNQSFLIQIMNQIKDNNDIVLFMYGDGIEEMKLRHMSESLKLNNVFFKGKTLDVLSAYCGSDLFLFPSVYEGLGLVAIEAQCTGLKCIASDRVPLETNAGGLVEYVPLEKEDCWINKVLAASINSAQERIAMSKKAQEELVRNGYDLFHNSKVLLNIYCGVDK